LSIARANGKSPGGRSGIRSGGGEEWTVVATVAEELRTRREERGLTREGVREQLGIPVHYVEAMEGAGTPLIADEFYLIPYLRRYAEFLESNPSMVVARFLAESGRDQPRGPARQRSGGGGRIAWIAVSVALVVVLAVLWLNMS
jgi:cytoskeletal protein RodZ